MPRTISNYMVKDPIGVSSDVSLEDIMQLMTKKNLSHLIVSNDDSDVVGVISKTDILSKVKYLLRETTGKTYSDLVTNSITANDIMTANFIPVKPDDSVDYGVELLLQKEFHCLPVVEDGKPVGIVTFYDLLKGYYQEHG